MYKQQLIDEFRVTFKHLLPQDKLEFWIEQSLSKALATQRKEIREALTLYFEVYNYSITDEILELPILKD